jgi:hypothetical protein
VVQVPRKGRIVLMATDPHEHAVGVITRVFGDTCVNVRTLEQDPTHDHLYTSVHLAETEAEAREFGGHVAWWPPRV